MSGVGRVLGVTGATGYVGSAVLAAAAVHGWCVVSLGRRPVSGANLAEVLGHREADLAQPPAADLVDGLDAVLHLAAVTDDHAAPADAELRFATALAQSCAARGQRLLFVSSQTAAAPSSRYGRTKAAIERAVLPLGAVVVRPGMVYGGAPSGLYGLLVSLVRKLPLLPDLRPRPRVQPIHVEDLAAALLAALDDDGLRGQTLTLAGPPVSFRTFLSTIARHRLRVRRAWIPVPVSALRLLLRATVRLDSRLSPERLDSLVGLPMLDARSDLQRLGIHLRDLRDGLSTRGRPDRRLLEEARALGHALLRRRFRPAPGLLRRYVRAIRAGDEVALDLPTMLLRRPTWIAALDSPAARRGGAMADVAARMTVFSRLAECEPTLVDAFLLRPGRQGRLRVIWSLADAAMSELHARVISLLARAAARRM